MSIKKILIANRGEIAIRIVKTAKKMGINTVAIKTSSEPNALYLNFADEVYDNSSSNSPIPVFLDIQQLIEIAKATGSDALHPGYGFLSENALLAKSCEENNIVFIGPSHDSIRDMGNKTIAREIALKNGIPMTGGSNGALNSSDEAIEVAGRIGYPVILKAVSGGGGRGMRIVREPSEMAKMFSLATNEARKAFNDPSVFVEKYVENPRHIEFQILGDKYGNVVHLGERECSIQRKHQKLFEEAPSIALCEQLREQMGAVAVKMAKAAGYYSAGTVEFLLDSNMNFYFMEMNTRIQVEHPVTEAITGIDLIEQQIRIANGEKLSFGQDEVQFNGWAFECRINAEDVQANFVPVTGRLLKLFVPDEPYVRLDTGVAEGTTISTNFDSMIAKLIVHGNTREETIKKCSEILDKMEITGLKTTIPFFRMLMKDARFTEGDFNTSLVEKRMEKYYSQTEDEKFLSAWFATKLFVEENLDTKHIDIQPDKNINVWLMSKRISSF
jgi:acetyl-CoA carboxylase biotin carboxylase subunit